MTDEDLANLDRIVEEAKRRRATHLRRQAQQRARERAAEAAWGEHTN